MSNILERTEANTPANEAKIRGMDTSICQSCHQPLADKTDLCPICSAAMHEELDEVMETFPPGEERLKAIRGVKAGYGYKLY